MTDNGQSHPMVSPYLYLGILDLGVLIFCGTMAFQAPSRVLVAGAGVIGLRTAIELARRNVEVVLRAPHDPVQESCSVVAGGYWMPFHCDGPSVEKWALETLDELHHFAQSQSDLVEIVPAVIFYRGRPQEAPSWTKHPRLDFQHLTVEMMAWQNEVHRLKLPPLNELKEAGYLHSWFFRSVVVNTPAMLNHFLNELTSVHGADVDVQSGTTFQSLEHLQDSASEMDCQMVINCTGLGAREVVPDPDVVPARGVLLHFDRDACVRRSPVAHGSYGPNSNDVVISVFEEPWASETQPAYLIPRGSSIVVGGTYLEGDEETLVRDAERKKILKNAEMLGIDLDSVAIKHESVGFRPYRSPVRCEFDKSGTVSDRIPIFHSYGYGGSGWTVDVGAARECADRVLGRQ